MSQQDSPRTWIAVVTARAAVRMLDDQRVASPYSSNPVKAVRIPNQHSYPDLEPSPQSPKFVGGLVVEVAGSAESAGQAASVLGGVGNAYLPLVALAANSAVDEPKELRLYAPPPSETDEGEFVVQRYAEPRPPATKLRKLAATDLIEVLNGVNGHECEEELHRAAAHYRQALGNLTALDRVLSAESLWMAVENLSHVLLHRLRREHGLRQDPAGKHDLAVALGLKPKDQRDSNHLNALDGHLRRTLIFGGDRDCYKGLKDLSNGFEHGYMSFSEIQAHSEVTERAFGYVRDAWLREAGIPAESPVRQVSLRNPLASWAPGIEMHGTYSDTDAARRPLPNCGPRSRRVAHLRRLRSPAAQSS